MQGSVRGRRQRRRLTHWLEITGSQRFLKSSKSLSQELVYRNGAWFSIGSAPDAPRPAMFLS